MRCSTLLPPLVGVAICAACTSQQPIVGALQPLSGDAGLYGRSVDGGMQVALDDIREAYGLPEGFALVTADTESDPTTAVLEFHRLVEERKVRLVVGGITTDEAMALLPVAEEAGIICLSPTVSTSDLGGKSKNFYRLFPTDKVEGQTAANHLYNQRGVRSVLIFTDDSLYTRGMESKFRQHFQLKLQGTVYETIHLASSDWRTHATDMVHAYDPDAVYIIGYAQKIFDVLEHLQGTGFDGIRCTTSTIYVSDLIRRSSELADGVVFPLLTYDLDAERNPTKAFVDRYQQRFGLQPDIYAAHGYDAMQVALKAFETASNLYTSELRKAMSFGVADMPGVTGTLSFNDSHEVRRYPVMHCVSKGQVMSWARYRELRIKRIKQQHPQLLPASEADTQRPAQLETRGDDSRSRV